MSTPVYLTAGTYAFTVFMISLTAATAAAIYRRKANGSWLGALTLALTDFCSLQISNGISPAANAGIKVTGSSIFISGLLICSGLTSAAIFSPEADTGSALAEAITPWNSHTWATEPAENQPMIRFNLPGEPGRTRREIEWILPHTTTTTTTTTTSTKAYSSTTPETINNTTTTTTATTATYTNTKAYSNTTPEGVPPLAHRPFDHRIWR